MDAGAPQPAIVAEGDALWLAYRTHRGDHFAVLRFRGLRNLALGEPNHGRVNGNTRSASGLNFYAFQEVTNPGADGADLRRWLVTFRDETLDVTALAAEVVERAIEAADSASALAMVRA
ncbi:MAG TPA: hypothetical protein VMJ30_07115 [Gemmatimonadales bacterium]|nr:hypothetical protein [Gemmatimonadales bacterium]